jgi:hypothetical protein
MSHYAALAAQIEQAVIDLAGVDKRVNELLTQARQSSDRAYLEAAALYLHTFYSGVEQIFVDIAREIDENVPAHENWHMALLRQMAAEVPTRRPPVITIDSRHCLDEYRAFRHVVRNVYTFNLNPNRIAELADGLPACYQAVQHDLEQFRRFLLAMA